MPRVPPKQLAPGGASDGDHLIFNAASNDWEPTAFATSLPVIGDPVASPGNDLPAPQIFQVSNSVPSTGASGWVPVFPPLYTYSAPTSTEDVVIVEVMGAIKYTDTSLPAPGNTTLQAFYLRSEWTISSGGDTETVLVSPQGSGASNVRLVAIPAGPNRFLALQVNEGSDASLTVTCSATCKISSAVGEIS